MSRDQTPSGILKQNPNPGGEPPEIKRAALLTATLAAFITPFMGSSINIALPTIGNELSMDAVELGWVATAYLLTAAMFLVPIGKLSDIYGRRRIFSGGIVIYSLASLLAALTPTGAWLIGARIVQGAGGAMIFGTRVAILTSVFPSGERGKVLGINIAAVYLGLSLGPFIGGLLTQHLGWRSIFLLNVGLGGVAAVITFWKLRGEWREAREDRFDLGGALIYSVMLVTLMVGFSRLPRMMGLWLILLSLAGAVIFVRRELRTPSPVLDMALFRGNPAFAFSNLAALINYSATYAVTFLLSLYLQYSQGLSPQSAGIILVAQPVVMALFSPLAGKLSDRVEPRRIASFGMVCTTIGLILMAFIRESTPLSWIVLSLVVVGFGFALFSSPNTNAIMSSVEKKSYGVASAMVATMRMVGQMFSMGIAMLLFALFIGNVRITPENLPSFLLSMRFAFILFGILCFGGIFASLARGNMGQEVERGA